jgi:hypothetical protein
MPRSSYEDDDDDADRGDSEDLDERDDPDESDTDDDEGDEHAETVACPYCGKPVYEGAELCPHCKSFISFEDAPPPRRPWWIWAGVAGGLAAVLWCVL